MALLKIGDEVERREWVSGTRGRVIDLSGDGTGVTVRVGA
jgi:hypothetical protein